MCRFRAQQLTVSQALAELGLGRTRFYELFASYLAACAKRRVASWSPASSGGNHRKPMPESVAATLRKLLTAAPPCSYSLAASEALRRHDFAIDRATVRRWALREGIPPLGPRKKAPRPVRRWQVAQIGQPWQYDASPHRWFHGQDRQPSLLEIIDFSQPRDPGRLSRDRKEDTAPNQMLNYGYTVLAALCHRSLLIHGLTPALGVKHMTRYRSTPLVFDLMEPFRPLVDMMLAEFMAEPDMSMKAWAKKVGTELRERRVAHERYSLKLMDAIDSVASSMARSYSAKSVEPFWVPEL